MDPEFDMYHDLGIPVNETVIHVGGFVLTRAAGTNRYVSADMLLERGVAPDIIAYATRTTIYYQYRVKEEKDR